MSRPRIFLFILISFIAGIGAESFITVPIIVVLAMGLIAMAVLAYAWNRKKKNVAIGALIILACIAGIIRMQYAKQHAGNLDAFSGRHVTVLGIVAQDPRFTEKNQLVVLKVKEINHDTMSVPVHISLLLRKYPAYQRGDIIASQGVFEATSYNGVTSGILFSSSQEKKGEEDIGVFFRLLRTSKQAFNAHIDAELPEPHASFMKGLLLGERAAMPTDLIQKFRQAGVSHIIALSGYNITLVGTFLVNALLMLTVPFHLTFWIAGSSIILFVLLTGAQASLMRAAIMGMLVLIAAREGRMYHMTNALVCAGMFMLAANPYLLRFDAGFQLSFLATLGLIYLTAPVDRVLTVMEYKARLLVKKRIQQEKEHRLVNGIKKIMSETIAAQLSVLPLLIYSFGGVSLIAPLSNLFVLIAIPSAMAFGFLIGALGFIWQPISAVAGWCAWVVLQYELFVIYFFSQISLSFVSVSFVGEILIIIAYGIVGFIWWKKKRKRRLEVDNL